MVLAARCAVSRPRPGTAIAIASTAATMTAAPATDTSRPSRPCARSHGARRRLRSGITPHSRTATLITLPSSIANAMPRPAVRGETMSVSSITTGYRPTSTSRNDFQWGTGVPSAVWPATHEPKPVGMVCCRKPRASVGSFASHAARSGRVEPRLEHRLVVEVDDDDPLVTAAGRRVDLGRLVARVVARQRGDLALPRQERVGPVRGEALGDDRRSPWAAHAQDRRGGVRRAAARTS